MIAYRGQDLDLRGASEWGPAMRAPAAGEPARNRQIWVDDTVLACCNHAFDLAVAHRAGEVRLEHMLNAMTRIDAAALVLENRGIRVAALRRESAGIIANEIATAHYNGRPQPRTSEALEDVLRMSEERAAHRRSPTTIDDILMVLFDMKRDLPGAGLLRNHSQNWNLRDSGEPRYEPQPAPAYAPSQARYQPGDDQREWVRVPAGSAPYQAPVEPVRPSLPPTMVPSSTDTIQNSRIDALERAIRDLALSIRDDSSRNRSGLDERLQSLEQAVMAARNEPAGWTAMAGDRLAAVERNVDGKFSELARGWALLGERLQSIEHALSSRTEPIQIAGIDAVDRRMVEIERQIQTMIDRAGALERAIANRPAATVDLGPLADRLTALERVLASRPATPINVTAIGDRLATLERLLTARPAATVELGPINERLNGLSEKLQSLEGWATEAAHGSTEANERLGRFERLVETGNATTDRGVGQIAERLRAVEEVGASMRTQMGQIGAHVAAQVGQQLGAQLASQIAPALSAEVRAATAAVIGERLQHLANAFERQQAQVVSAVASPLNDRVAMLDRAVASYAQQTGETVAAHQRDLKEVHEALVKINANQQTIAGSMDQWRLDMINDLGEVANQVTNLQQASTRPLQAIESLSASFKTLEAAKVRREEHRSRFRYWLLGTDDWYGASYGANGSKPPSRLPVERV